MVIQKHVMVASSTYFRQLVCQTVPSREARMPSLSRLDNLESCIAG